MNLINISESNYQYLPKQNINISLAHKLSFYQSSLNFTTMKSQSETLGRRKSFREFTETSRESFVRIKSQLPHKNLIVSFNSLIKPIHNRFRTEASPAKQNEKQQACRMSISKTRIYHKSKQQHFQLKWQRMLKSQGKGFLIFSSKPIVRKKVPTFKAAEANQGFECRPWTRRGEREQNEQNLDVSTKIFPPIDDEQF